MAELPGDPSLFQIFAMDLAAFYRQLLAFCLT